MKISKLSDTHRIYLISLTYLKKIFKKIYFFWAQMFSSFFVLRNFTNVIEGDSLRPIQNPIAAKQMQITGNVCANPSITQEMVSGMVTIKIVFRRPNLSQTGPLNKLPIGCAMWAKLAANKPKINKWKKKKHVLTYKAMTFELRSLKPFRLDSSRSRRQSMRESQSMEMLQIRPN